MYPKFPTNLSNPVQADSTQHWTVSTTQRLKSAALASAEVIAEAPSSRSGVLPLADFGSVSFANATANGVSLAALNPDPISMVSGSTTKAQPGNISSNGSFSVTWKHSNAGATRSRRRNGVSERVPRPRQSAAARRF